MLTKEEKNTLKIKEALPNDKYSGSKYFIYCYGGAVLEKIS